MSYEKTFTGLKTKELNEQLDLYRTFDDIVVPAEDSEELSNNEKRISVLDALRAEHGVAYTVTEEDVAAHPKFVENEIDAGEIVLLTPAELAELETAPEGDEKPGDDTKDQKDPGAAPEGAQEGAGASPTATEDAKDEAAAQAAVDAVHPGAATPADTIAPEVAAEFRYVDGMEATYLGRTVTSVSNKIISGALYKEVHTPTESFTITEAEFHRDVKPRA